MSELLAPAGPRADEWATLLPLFREINDLKRVRSTEFQPSIAAVWFRHAAGILFHSPEGIVDSTRTRLAFKVTADVVSATRLGAISQSDLAEGGLNNEFIREIRIQSIRERKDALDEESFNALVEAVAGAEDCDNQSSKHEWIERLIAQPRAGATAPGQPRIVLEPVESCAEHCLVTAAYAVLLAPSFGADPGDVFAIGLAHHLHNARLPDAGFAGEALIGEHLDGLIETLRQKTSSTMSTDAATHIRPLLSEIASADTPLARTFHTADTIDRVLQIEYFARCNTFTLEDALVGMELVHAGPVQAFQQIQLNVAGLGQL